MNLQINSFGDLSSIKEGDFIFSPAISKVGEKYYCTLYKYKVKNFLAKTVKVEMENKVQFDEFDVVLERQYGDDEDENKEISTLTTNLRHGFCTDSKEAKVEILKLFLQELQNMASAIDAMIQTID